MRPGSTWVHSSSKVAFPGRAVDKPGGAEAAAPGAAPAGLHQEHLAPFALGGQDMAVGRVGGQLRQVGGGHPLGEARLGLKGRQGAVGVVAGRVARGHVGAGDGVGQVPEQGGPVRGRGALGQKLEEGHRPGLAFPQEEGVHEGSQGLGVEEGGHPAGQDQGVAGAAVRGLRGMPAPARISRT